MTTYVNYGYLTGILLLSFVLINDVVIGLSCSFPRTMFYDYNVENSSIVYHYGFTEVNNSVQKFGRDHVCPEYILQSRTLFLPPHEFEVSKNNSDFGRHNGIMYYQGEETEMDIDGPFVDFLKSEKDFSKKEIKNIKRSWKTNQQQGYKADSIGGYDTPTRRLNALLIPGIGLLLGIGMLYLIFGSGFGFKKEDHLPETRKDQ